MEFLVHNFFHMRRKYEGLYVRQLTLICATNTVLTRYRNRSVGVMQNGEEILNTKKSEVKEWNFSRYITRSFPVHDVTESILSYGHGTEQLGVKQWESRARTELRFSVQDAMGCWLWLAAMLSDCASSNEHSRRHMTTTFSVHDVKDRLLSYRRDIRWLSVKQLNSRAQRKTTSSLHLVKKGLSPNRFVRIVDWRSVF